MKKNFSEKSRRRDRLAELFIRIGGILVIVAVVWILVMISQVALPLFYSPDADISATVQLPAELKERRILAAGVDDSRQQLFMLDENGRFHLLDAASGSELDESKTATPPAGSSKIVSVEQNGASTFNLLWNNNAVSSVALTFNSSRSEDGKTVVSSELTEEPLLAFAGDLQVKETFARKIENGALRVDRLDGDRFRVTHRLVEKDIQENEKVRLAKFEITDKLPGKISATVLDHKGRYLYAGTENGWLVRWDVTEPDNIRLLESIQVTNGVAVTALNLVFGDYSLAIGDAAGGYSTWFPVTTPGSSEKLLRKIHQLPGHGAAVTSIVPSGRDKSLISVNAKGDVRIDHMTTERTLVKLGVAPASGIARVAYTPRGNGMITLDKSGKVAVWKLDIPHPEISFKTLFGKVWYEGYDKPEYAWQSSAANDDFEPKMSLVPLIFGTIKATFFAMLFAVPLALCGAIYTSQFMTPTLKSRVKPVVEIMAAIPSVVIGFLAGLWLAPMLEKSVLMLFVSLLVIPALLFAATLLWSRIKTASRLDNLLRGREFAVIIPLIAAGFCLAWFLTGMAESTWFSGDFKQWLYSSFNIRYDNRNSIIIAIALGFAVIPIIFTIAEDALSNVPRNLQAASLALGASRWQTAWRVVLPSALPGVFSAIMVGFGRAIGETMIVLMAAGNTPIMSWSLFNGLRSLSANIAVEIPEAPMDGSLYRVLFLSAVILFIFTFIINTLAEALRQRFRKKYGRY